MLHCAQRESTTLISPYSSEPMITERFGLEFRTEFFDLFNHPQWGFPGHGLQRHAYGQRIRHRDLHCEQPASDSVRTEA